MALVVSSLLVQEAILSKVGIARIIRQAIELSGQASRLSPDQVQKIIEQGGPIQAALIRLGSLVEAPFIVLVVAALGLLLLGGIFEELCTFRGAFSVSAYAYLPVTVRNVMALAVVMFGDPENFNIQVPAPSSPGFFLNPHETSRPLMALAASIDVFTFWFLALLAIGFSELTGRKVKPLPIFFTYLGLRLVVILGGMLLAMMF